MTRINCSQYRKSKTSQVDEFIKSLYISVTSTADLPSLGLPTRVGEPSFLIIIFDTSCTASNITPACRLEWVVEPHDL